MADQQTINYSRKTAQAVKKYGPKACDDAYKMSLEGYGGRGVSIEGPAILRTTQAADAAINAGREMAELWKRTAANGAPDETPCTGCTAPGCTCGLIPAEPVNTFEDLADDAKEYEVAVTGVGIVYDGPDIVMARAAFAQHWTGGNVTIKQDGVSIL